MTTKTGFDHMGNGINPITGNPYSDKYKELAKKWSKLPAYEKASDLVSAIKNNQITLIASGTGSGKTLLTPRFALEVFDYKGKIAITLPKQILTISNATYQADISDLELGKHVGYVFKGSDKKYSNNENLLTYATDGTIVAQLLKDPSLKDFNCVIIDEAHERKVQIDLLLYLLKQTCTLRKDFKLIIMSATVNETIFQEYFSDFGFAYFNIGSKTNYPISSIFLDKSLPDDKAYIEKGFEIINNILDKKNTGDILFFVTSIQETIDSCKKVNISMSKYNVYCSEVYAGMNETNQELAQDESLYKKKFNKNIKIVFATNVAESSLTISGIKYVIDSGLELSSHYDPDKGAKVLEKKLITHAQAKQRMGRSGRTGPGTCYHLYTENDFENIMEKFPQPTIRTSNISGECLRLLNLPIISSIDNLKETLNKFIEPPTIKYIQDAVKTLMRLGLIENNSITPLGKCVAEMQVDPIQGVSIYAGYNMKCVKEVIAVIAMCDAIKNNISGLFITPQDLLVDDITMTGGGNINEKFNNAKKSFTHKMGDHMTLLKIFSKYVKLRKDESKLNDWLYKSFLRRNVLEKALTYFKKIRGISMRLLSSLNSENKIENIMSYDTNIRVMSSILFGYKYNVAFYREKTYATEKVNNAIISKDSWMNSFDNPKKEVVYNELFVMNKKIDLQIVSHITPKIRELCNKL